MPKSQIRRWCENADVLLVADGAVDRLPTHLHPPTVLIGDLDSSSLQGRKSAALLHFVDEQDSTDCEKVLSYAKGHFANDAMAIIGLEGDAFDHVLGSLYSIAASSLDPLIAFRRGYGRFVRPGSVAKFDVPIGTRISLLPIGRCAKVTLTGVRWPLDQAEMDPIGLASVSNAAVSTLVTAELGNGVALLYRESDGAPMWLDDGKIG